MSDKRLDLSEGFEPAAMDAWRALAEKALKGAPLEKLTSRTLEGLSIQALYAKDDWSGSDNASGFPGAAPYTRGGRPLGTSETGWDIRQIFSHPDPRQTNREILQDLERGVTSVELVLDGAGKSGVAVQSARSLGEALHGVLFDIAPVAVEPGGLGVVGAALLGAVWEHAEADPAAVLGAFNLDPLGTLARLGTLSRPYDTELRDAALFAAKVRDAYPKTTAWRVDTRVYHDGGADAAEETALALATGVAYLRAGEAAGMSPEETARSMLFTVSVDADQFFSIAKIRALRSLWSAVLDACGAAPVPMQLQAQTSARMMTRSDPYTNILRTTVAAFSAAVAGADAITVLPFTQACGVPEGFARRIARNTQIILMEESNLHRVVDPAGGSFALESLSDQIAQAAWARFREIEAGGGMAEELSSGTLQTRLADQWDKRRARLATRRDALTGISEFAQVEVPAMPLAEVDAGGVSAGLGAEFQATNALEVARACTERLRGAEDDIRIGLLLEAARAEANIPSIFGALTLGGRIEGDRMVPVTAHRLSEDYDALREIAAAARARGAGPRVFLANLGPLAEHSARMGFAKNLFAAGGIDTFASEPIEDRSDALEGLMASGAKVACLCSSDAIYAETAAQIAASLKRAGVERLYLAGKPGDLETALREAGVTDFIFMGCDALSVLADIHSVYGLRPGA